MSGRAKRGATEKIYEEVESDVDLEEAEKSLSRGKIIRRDGFGAGAPPPKKKARKPAASYVERRRVAGVLSSLPEMPLDVIIEIFSHLHLRDFLAVAKVSRMFRSLLFSAHTKSLWTTGCLTKSLTLNLKSRMRCCYTCSRKIGKVVLEVNMETRLHAEGLHDYAWRCVVFRKIIFFDGEILEFGQSINAVSDEIFALEIRAGSNGPVPARTYQSQSRSTRITRRSVVVAGQLGNERPGEAAVIAFVAERRAWVVKFEEESSALSTAFYASESEERRLNKAEESRRVERRQARYAAIKAKAFESGYTEDELRGAFRQPTSPFIISPYEFTEQEWERNRAGLITIFEASKAEHVAQELQLAAYYEERRHAVINIRE